MRSMPGSQKNTAFKNAMYWGFLKAEQPPFVGHFTGKSRWMHFVSGPVISHPTYSMQRLKSCVRYAITSLVTRIPIFGLTVRMNFALCFVRRVSKYINLMGNTIRSEE